MRSETKMIRSLPADVIREVDGKRRAAASGSRRDAVPSAAPSDLTTYPLPRVSVKVRRLRRPLPARLGDRDHDAYLLAGSARQPRN